MSIRILTLSIILFLTGIGGFGLGRIPGQSATQIGPVLPADHPVTQALNRKSELKLTQEQTVKLTAIKAELETRFAKVNQRLAEIQARMESAKANGDEGEARLAAEDQAKLAQEVKETLAPYVESTGRQALEILTDEQRAKLTGVPQGPEKHDLLLGYIMEHRDQIGVTPQQFTKLMYLQADLIRAVAPIREQVELLQEQAKASKDPADAQAVMEKVVPLAAKVEDLKKEFSRKATEEVLDEPERKKLQQLLAAKGATAESF